MLKKHGGVMYDPTLTSAASSEDDTDDDTVAYGNPEKDMDMDVMEEAEDHRRNLPTPVLSTDTLNPIVVTVNETSLPVADQHHSVQGAPSTGVVQAPQLEAPSLENLYLHKRLFEEDMARLEGILDEDTCPPRKRARTERELVEQEANFFYLKKAIVVNGHIPVGK
jgi:hypothetical protein